jgi:UDP-N-acetylglucosamine 2-epimerase
MLDAFMRYRSSVEGDLAAGKTRLPEVFGNATESPKDFCLLTVHRAENTDDRGRLAQIVSGLDAAGRPAIFPVHPRTRARLAEYGLAFGPHVRLVEPVGYLAMLELGMRCSLIVTDSGGVQKEAYFLAKPCVTLRDQTEWVETVDSGWNVLAGADPATIARALQAPTIPPDRPPFYGDGTAGRAMLQLLSRRD